MKKLILALALLLTTVSCSGSQSHAAVVAVVAGGGVVNELQALHQAAYRAAVRPLPNGPAYNVAVAPIDAEFATRGLYIQALASNLIAAAAIIDAAKTEGTVADYQAAATMVLEALERTVAALRNGGLLAPIPIPASVSVVISQLRVVIAGGL